jgi:hypothetical protein
VARRLRRIRGRAYQLAGAFNGAGVRQGTLLPPTEAHRRRKRSLETALARELARLDALLAEAEGERGSGRR